MRHFLLRVDAMEDPEMALAIHLVLKMLDTLLEVL